MRLWRWSASAFVITVEVNDIRHWTWVAGFVAIAQNGCYCRGLWPTQIWNVLFFIWLYCRHSDGADRRRRVCHRCASFAIPRAIWPQTNLPQWCGLAQLGQMVGHEIRIVCRIVINRRFTLSVMLLWWARLHGELLDLDLIGYLNWIMWGTATHRWLRMDGRLMNRDGGVWLLYL